MPVHLHSKVTEVGTLELWCISRDGKQSAGSWSSTCASGPNNGGVCERLGSFFTN